MNSANNIGHVSCGIKTKLVDFSNKMAPVIVWFSSYRVMFKDTMYWFMFKDIKQCWWGGAFMFYKHLLL